MKAILPWLRTLVSFPLGLLAIDIAAIVGVLATQPIWFKVLNLATLPLQV